MFKRFKNIKLKYIIIHLIVTLAYPAARAFRADKNRLMLFTDAMTVIGALLIVLGVFYGFYLRGDFDRTSYVFQRGAVRNGIVYSETFSHVAGLSSAVHIFDPGTVHNPSEMSVFDDIEKAAGTNVNPRTALRQLQEEGRPLPKFYLSCGTSDDLYDANVSFRDFLLSNKADVTWDEDGSGHEWSFWDSQIKKVLEWLPLDENDNGLGSGNVRTK